MNNKLLKHALALQKRGYAVLPLHHIVDGACGDEKCGRHSGKHPRIRGGHLAASKKRSQIKKWWSEFPHANIGIVTGSVSGIVVIDVDPRNGGRGSLKRAIAELGPLPKTARVHSGGDGDEHRYFTTPNFPVRTDKGKVLGDGLDVLSDKAYVVAPPSSHLSGKFYRHDKSCSLLQEGSVRPLPKRWLERLRKGAPKAKRPSSLTPVASDEIPDGKRDETLIRKAGSLVRLALRTKPSCNPCCSLTKIRACRR